MNPAMLTAWKSRYRVSSMHKINVEYQQLTQPHSFSSPFHGDEFAVLLYVTEESISPQTRARISAALVAQGCRYAVCAGHHCSLWDDSIDIADLERNDWEPKDENFVMTTWHNDESLEDIVFVFFFFLVLQGF